MTDHRRLKEQIQLLDGKITLETIYPELAEIKHLAYHYAIGNDWHVHQISYDPWNATYFKNEMDALGYQTLEAIQQMRHLNEPTKMFRELVASGKLVHDGSPLLTWCVGNAQEIVDTKENIMISKKKAGNTRRVDLLAAILDAMIYLQPLQEAQKYAKYIKSKDFGF